MLGYIVSRSGEVLATVNTKMRAGNVEYAWNHAEKTLINASTGKLSFSRKYKREAATVNGFAKCVNENLRRFVINEVNA
jgi:hypothetical protein